MKPTQQKALLNRAAGEIARKQAEKWRLQTVQQMYAVMLTVLHDKWDFKADQLVDVLEQITEQFACIGDKYVKIEDFYELLDDMGIKVV